MPDFGLDPQQFQKNLAGASSRIGGLFGGLQKRPGIAQPGQAAPQSPAAPKGNIDPYGSQRGPGQASSPSGGDFSGPKIQRPVETGVKQPGAEMHPLLSNAFKNPSMWRDSPSQSYTAPSVSSPMMTVKMVEPQWFESAPHPELVPLGQVSGGGGQVSTGPTSAPGSNMARGVEAQAALEHARSGGMPTSPESIKLFQEAQNLKARNPEVPVHERLMNDPTAEIGSFARALAADKVQEGSPEWLAKMQGFMAARKTSPQEIQKSNEPKSFGWSSSAGPKGGWGLGGLQFSQGQTPESRENMSVLQRIQEIMQKTNGSGAGVP